MNHLCKSFLFLFSLFFIGCSDESNDENVFFHVSITDIRAHSVLATITHNATNRDSYYGFVVKGIVQDVQAEIERFLSSSNRSQLLEIEHHQRKTVFRINELAPKTSYTYIVFGMNDYGTFGVPAKIEFTTVENDFVAMENSNWLLYYEGNVVYKDVDYSLVSVQIKGDAMENYFFVTYKADYLNNFPEMEDLITYATDNFIKEANQAVGDGYWLEYPKIKRSSLYFYRYLTEGDYVSFVFGLDSDGLPTGHYATTGIYHVDRYPATECYTNLLGDWIVNDDNGQKFRITFIEQLVNYSLIMTGWGGFDYPVIVRCNRNCNILEINAQLVSENENIIIDEASHNGNVYLIGAYHTKGLTGRWCYQTNKHTVTMGHLLDNKTYYFDYGFGEELPPGADTTRTGMTFYLTSENKTYPFAFVRFPFNMKKVNL